MSNEFSGKRALVTGGTKGIGAAVVSRLRDGGATVVTTARKISVDLAHPELFIEADVATAAGAADVGARALKMLGGVDILVNVVGGSSAPAGGYAALVDADWLGALDLNLFASVRLDRAVLPGMIECGSGVIVHISSIQRRMPLYESTLAYAAAKAALTTYSKGLSNEVGPKGVRVVSVAPGWVETTASIAMVETLAAKAGTDYETAHRDLWPALH